MDIQINGHKNSLLITGKTYPWKDELKAFGGKWNGTLQGWIFLGAKVDGSKHQELQHWQAQKEQALHKTLHQAARVLPNPGKQIAIQKEEPGFSVVHIPRDQPPHAPLQSKESIYVTLKDTDKETDLMHIPMKKIESWEDSEDDLPIAKRAKKVHIISDDSDDDHPIAKRAKKVHISSDDSEDDLPMAKRAKKVHISSDDSDDDLPIAKRVADCVDKKEEPPRLLEVASIAPLLAGAVQTSLTPGLLHNRFFLSTQEFIKFRGTQLRQVGWLLFLQTQFPDLCLIYDVENDDTPFEYNPKGASRQPLKLRRIPPGQPQGQTKMHVTQTRKGVTQTKVFTAPGGYEFIQQSVRNASNSYHGIYMASWAPTMFESCVQSKHRYSVFLLKLGSGKVGHVNPLIYDAKNQVLYRFEMHGSQKARPDVDEGLRNWIQRHPILKKYVKEYKSPHQFCPRVGPQMKECQYQREQKVRRLRGESKGYCAAWMLLFVHAVLTNPHLTIEEVTDALTQEDGLTLHKRIREYTSFVMHEDTATEERYYTRGGKDRPRLAEDSDSESEL